MTPGRQADVATIDALLPQTQCRRCGFEGCLPYAQALADRSAPINRCPPGGSDGIAALAALLETPVLPLDPACGTEQDPGVAFIDASACIGCARCLPPCPVDAIVGAQRHLHTVLESHCTGCELCLASCPVDCIVMRPRSPDGITPEPGEDRARYHRHLSRSRRESQQRATLLSERKRAALTGPSRS